MATLKLRKLDKGGSAYYELEGVRGSIWVSKAMFAGDPPQALEVNYDGFSAPGTARVSPRNATPEQIEKVRVAAEKAEERAKKAQERAEKAKARAAKYSKGSTETAAEPQPVTA